MVAALDPDPDLFIDVPRSGLHDEQPVGGDQFGGAGEEGARVAADADVAVEEQRGVPRTLPGRELKTERCSAVPPMAVVRATAAALTSMPSVRRPWAASAATSRPGPQPMSRTLPAQRRSADRSAASARAHQRSTSRGSSQPSLRRRKSGPRPLRSASAYGSAPQACWPVSQEAASGSVPQESVYGSAPQGAASGRSGCVVGGTAVLIGR